MPVGMCVRRTAESVVLTHCPPFPDERNTSKRQSFRSSCTSTSSASGIMATVAVEVWMRPPDSVTGIRCTRCTPLSYFRREYAPPPSIIKMTSLQPPIPFSFMFIISSFQRFVSAYLLYMRNSSAANSAASSPPAPARISTITFFSSFGSFGSSRIFSCCSSRSTSALLPDSSSLASSRSSSSLSSSSMARLSSIFCFACL